eukprot:1184528-Prorocentrum_minimum.AAC.1
MVVTANQSEKYELYKPSYLRRTSSLIRGAGVAPVGDHADGVLQLVALVPHLYVIYCAGVAPVGDHADGVLQLVVLVPHLAAVAHHVGHGGVDDDVVGRVQVGDALRGVHHRQPAIIATAAPT